MNLMEAFKALDQLNEDVFSVDAEGIKKLNDFMQNDDSVDELSVFDIDSTEDDVIRDDEACNEGDMILDCCVCHSKVFKPTSEVIVDEESQVANAGEECPYCFSVEGYKVVGEVKPAGDNEVSMEDVSEENNEMSDEKADEDTFDLKPEENVEVDTGIEVSHDVNKDSEVEDEPEVKESVKDRIIKCHMKDKRIDESIDLLTKDNTIASLLRDNMDNLSTITDVNELRDAIMDIVNESDIANKPAALKLKRDLYSKKSVGALLSTIGTYMTGEKVIKVGKNSRKSRRESFKHRRITESKIPAPYDKYFVITDEDDELVGDTVGGVKLISALDPKDPDVVDIFGYLTDDPDFPVVEIVGGRAYPVDLDKIEESLSKSKRMSRKESFKHRKIIKEDVDTIRITDDDVVISMSNDEFEDKDDSSIEDEDVKNDLKIEPVSDEAKEQIDFNSVDRESTEDVIEESLKESFGNVKFFRCSSIVPRNNRFIVEGVIGFNSGRKRNTNFVFKPRKITESTVIFKGYNKELKESVKSISLVCRNRGKKCIAESLKVSK